MEIKKVEPKVYEKSIFPGISFDVEISYTKYQEAIVGISGWLETDDEKIIAEIKEEKEAIEHREIGARGSSFDREFREDVYKTTLLALLNRRALSHIEKKRMGNTKRDVVLILNLNVKIIDSEAVISHVYEVKPEDIGIKPVGLPNATGKVTTGWEVLVFAYNSEYSTSKTNRWILSGDGKPVFLAISGQPLKEKIRIPSTDWIYDYAPKLGLGEYFIVEIPKGQKVIEEAWKYIEKAEECFRTCDTKGVYANCREVGTLLNTIITDEFGNSPAIKKWGKVIGEFNSSASLDLHEEDIKKGKPVGDIKIGIAETEHILIVTKALIKYAEELFIGHRLSPPFVH